MGFQGEDKGVHREDQGFMVERVINLSAYIIFTTIWYRANAPNRLNELFMIYVCSYTDEHVRSA